MTAPLPALILAAGRGQRMRPLTDHTPKPLLPVHGKPLIEWHLEALARDGIREVVINTDWLEEQFPAALGDGSRFGLSIRYSMEGRTYGGALETAGGLATAWPLLGAPPACWVLAGDVYAPDFRFDAAASERFLATSDDAHLWFVPNPAQHPNGDFWLDARGRVHLERPSRDEPHGAPGVAEANRYTYATIGLFKSSSVASVQPGQRAALLPCFKEAIARGRLGGSLYRGFWADVGTPERWQALQAA